MKETTKQSISILVITLIFAGVVLVLNKMTLPAFSEYQKNKITVEEKKEVLKEIENFKKIAEELNEKYIDTGEDFGKISGLMPNSPNFSDILAVIDAIGRNTKVTIKDITFRDIPNRKANSDLYSIAEVNLNIYGDYVSITNFFAEIEKDTRLMDVISLDMKRITNLETTKGKQKIDNSIDVSAIIQAYYQNN